MGQLVLTTFFSVEDHQAGAVVQGLDVPVIQFASAVQLFTVAAQ